MIIRVVAAAIFNDQGHILIVRRAKGQSGAGEWEFPGGKVELGENDHEALTREISEELSLKITVQFCIGENHINFGHKEILLVLYRSMVLSGDLKLCVHDDFQWVDVLQLNQFNLSKADLPFVTKLLSICP